MQESLTYNQKDLSYTETFCVYCRLKEHLAQTIFGDFCIYVIIFPHQVSHIPTEFPEKDLIKPGKFFHMRCMSLFMPRKTHTLQEFVWFALNTQH